MNKVFLIINLLQDVNIQRGLAFLSARDLGKNTIFLVMPLFRKRDVSGVWKKELEEISKCSGANIYYCCDEVDALQQLLGHKGILIAASESNLNAHKPVHDLFRIAPASFLKVTLQHGFECVGFLQSRDQDLAHGRNITFGADVICGWSEADKLTSVVSSQQSKLYVVGLPTCIFPRPSVKNVNKMGGLVCENMHSPRLNIAGDFKTDFLSIFNHFCDVLKSEGKKITLRPHPGGQYTLKNKVRLPRNVVIENMPIYKVDLSKYAYGISAPSSILIDMIIAKIPVGVWIDANGTMDAGNYQGLEVISSIEDWLIFSREALIKPEYFLKKQDLFIKKRRLIISPKGVFQRYKNLLNYKFNKSSIRILPNKEKILFIANANIPTLQLSFTKPLALLVTANKIATKLLTEQQMKTQQWKTEGYQSLDEWIQHIFNHFQPTLVVFCRYSGPRYKEMIKYANNLSVTTVYHIDDDLLNIPENIGKEKYAFHNQPKRLASVHFLLRNSTSIYCSTKKLKEHLSYLNLPTPIISGKIYCSGKIISEAYKKPVKKIGYMGIGHGEDLLSVVPALVKFMRKYKDIELELFGTIPVLDAFSEFSGRIKSLPKIENYAIFLQTLAEYEWDVGICPLTPIPFNILKANTKWVEYTAAGIAVIASKGTVYDDCCADGCGLLASTEDEWLAALETLTDPQKRFQQVKNAQKKLVESYSVERLREQVLDIFQQASAIHC